MLVLSRKLGERILIGDRIVVTVVKLDRGQVRLGIEAPPEDDEVFGIGAPPPFACRAIAPLADGSETTRKSRRKTLPAALFMRTRP